MGFQKRAPKYWRCSMPYGPKTNGSGNSTVTAERAREATALAERSADDNSRERLLEERIRAPGTIYFDLNSSYLGPGSKKMPDGPAQFLKDNGNIVLPVASHTDSRGAWKYNKLLSRRRAERTVSYLVEQGIAPERLNALALGEERLLIGALECRPITFYGTLMGGKNPIEF